MNASGFEQYALISMPSKPENEVYFIILDVIFDYMFPPEEQMSNNLKTNDRSECPKFNAASYIEQIYFIGHF